MRTAKVAIITGITGQDGIYLSDFLLQKGYEVHGIQRRVSYRPPFAVDPRVHIHLGDMGDAGSLYHTIRDVSPHEVYNLAAMTDVHESFATPVYTGDVNGLGLVRLLEAVRTHAPDARVYQASTSEMFGSSPPPQSEASPFMPRSPYAVAKLYAYWMARHYREAYGMFLSNGILFNHESPRRGANFVTKKIAKGLTRIAMGLQDCLYLGNLDADRDWGHSADCIRAQWMILQHPNPDDFVIATGAKRSVRDFVLAVASVLNMPLEWQGAGLEEVAVDTRSGRMVIRVDPRLFRPAEVMSLCGDATKARQQLGWEPLISFEELVREMVEFELATVGAEAPAVKARLP